MCSCTLRLHPGNLLPFRKVSLCLLNVCHALILRSNLLCDSHTGSRFCLFSFFQCILLVGNHTVNRNHRSLFIAAGLLNYTIPSKLTIHLFIKWDILLISRDLLKRSFRSLHNWGCRFTRRGRFNNLFGIFALLGLNPLRSQTLKQIIAYDFFLSVTDNTRSTITVVAKHLNRMSLAALFIGQHLILCHLSAFRYRLRSNLLLNLLALHSLHLLSIGNLNLFAQITRAHRLLCAIRHKSNQALALVNINVTLIVKHHLSTGNDNLLTTWCSRGVHHAIICSLVNLSVTLIYAVSKQFHILVCPSYIVGSSPHIIRSSLRLTTSIRLLNLILHLPEKNIRVRSYRTVLSFRSLVNRLIKAAHHILRVNIKPCKHVVEVSYIIQPLTSCLSQRLKNLLLRLGQLLAGTILRNNLGHPLHSYLRILGKPLSHSEFISLITLDAHIHILEHTNTLNLSPVSYLLVFSISLCLGRVFLHFNKSAHRVIGHHSVTLKHCISYPRCCHCLSLNNTHQLRLGGHSYVRIKHYTSVFLGKCTLINFEAILIQFSTLRQQTLKHSIQILAILAKLLTLQPVERKHIACLLITLNGRYILHNVRCLNHQQRSTALNVVLKPAILRLLTMQLANQTATLGKHSILHTEFSNLRRRFGRPGQSVSQSTSNSTGSTKSTTHKRTANSTLAKLLPVPLAIQRHVQRRLTRVKHTECQSTLQRSSRQIQQNAVLQAIAHSIVRIPLRCALCHTPCNQPLCLVLCKLLEHLSANCLCRHRCQ